MISLKLDRAVKIWVVRPTSEDRLKREDKPLFSSSRIHKGRVLSVTWYAQVTFLQVNLPNDCEQATTRSSAHSQWPCFNAHIPGSDEQDGARRNWRAGHLAMAGHRQVFPSGQRGHISRFTAWLRLGRTFTARIIPLFSSLMLPFTGLPRELYQHFLRILTFSID